MQNYEATVSLFNQLTSGLNQLPPDLYSLKGELRYVKVLLHPTEPGAYCKKLTRHPVTIEIPKSDLFFVAKSYGTCVLFWHHEVVSSELHRPFCLIDNEIHCTPNSEIEIYSFKTLKEAFRDNLTRL